jgi:hypothetical protein
MNLQKRNSGLQTPAPSCGKPAIGRPPTVMGIKRTSKLYAQRDKDRQEFGTSKDVMPVRAGYTSDSFPVLEHRRNIGSGYDFDAQIENIEIWQGIRDDR